jgi:hypothetical protein
MDKDTPISSMNGPQLLDYLNILSQRQAEYSKLKIDLTEQLVPIDQARAAKKADIQAVTERMKQCKIEIAGTKYALKGCNQ